MSHPTSIHLFGQMQHQEYERQAQKTGRSLASAISVPNRESGQIMGKVADLISEIRKQIANNTINDSVASAQ